jgi:catechol 2,3-dioxygenase-like lactoylglutathione lyase family enzyme
MHIDWLDHLVLTVKDIQASVAFYTRVLGMQADPGMNLIEVSNRLAA